MTGIHQPWKETVKLLKAKKGLFLSAQADQQKRLLTRLKRRLRRILPRNALILEPDAMKPYECDGLSAYRRLPLAVVIPSDMDQLRKVVALCHRMKVPIVVRGSGTSLSGGAMPHEGGILISMARFNRILEMDERRCLARVQPGVRNLKISEAAASHGLFYAPDPSSQIVCSIGGNVAENAGGIHCLKYGLTVHNILALQILTINGELMELSTIADEGPDEGLLALMIGSEGMLGIVVEITVRLRPIPPQRRVLMGSFAEVEHAAAAVGALIGAGIIPAGLELMDGPALRAAEEFVHAGYPKDAGAILLCELDGLLEQTESDARRSEQIMNAHYALAVRCAIDDQDQQKLWAGRKAAFPAVGRISPDYYCMDGTIPRRHLPNVLKRISVLSSQYQQRVVNVFHAGDGNLHPLILYDASIPGEFERTEALGAEILRLALEVGGSITGEHGVGVEKIDVMCDQFGSDELEIFHAIKKVFDPDGLLNPGKAVPTLHRCAEMGAMHVHHGALPHPDLPRF